MNDFALNEIATLNFLPFPRLCDWFGAWLYEPERFRAEWDALKKTDLLAHMRDTAEKPPQPTAQALMVEGKGGKKVAMIPLHGTLMKSRSSSGGTSTIDARREIRLAARDPEVSGILLDIWSPGGTAAGTADLANEVKVARRTKPVFAHIDDLGASAAYWVASQASKVTANAKTAMVGSIGTLLTIAQNTSGDVAVFSTGPLKAPGMSGELTDEQRSYYQSLVEGLQSSFDEAVKSGRRMSQKELDAVRHGGVFLATEAKTLKLIDGIQSRDTTLAELMAAQ